jgi:hypothetical protein
MARVMRLSYPTTLDFANRLLSIFLSEFKIRRISGVELRQSESCLTHSMVASDKQSMFCQIGRFGNSRRISSVKEAQLKLFRGAKHTLKRKSVLAFVVEFTEENMRKSGYSALQLTGQLIEFGYRPYKLAAETAEIIPFEVNESPEYENILFTHDLAAVLDRIERKLPENARRSKEIIDRGLAAEALVHSLGSIEKKEATKRLALINELTDACQVRDKRINELTAGRSSMDTTVATLRGLFYRKR